jgi:hydrogenase maturation protease
MVDLATRGPLPILDGSESCRLLILGLGNPMMADDGIGHEVVSRLERSELPKGVRLFAIDGDVLDLMEVWRGETEVWLVDAVRSRQPAGALHVYGHQNVLQLPADRFSAHHPSVGECLRWMLHARPEMAAIEFRLYGIEVRSVRPARRLGRAVARAVDRLVGDICTATRHLDTPPIATPTRRDEKPGQTGDSVSQS